MDTRIKVLFLAKDSGFGGVVSCTANLAKGLRDFYGIESIVGINKGLGTEQRLSNEKVFSFVFGTKNPLKIVKNYFLLKRICRNEGITIIHAQNRIPALYASFYCFFHRKVKYIWANHLVPIPHDFFHRITTKIGGCAVTESQDGKKMLHNDLKIPLGKIEVINLGVDVDLFLKTPSSRQEELKNHLGIDKGEIVILLYGRLSPNKGHLYLLEALNKAKHKNIKAIFPGENETYKKEIVAHANNCSLKDKIIFPGYVNGVEYLSISDLVILPSIHEGYPVSCVEAFCMGVPVIRTITGGFEDTKEYCTGVEYGDVDRLANLIDSFIDGDHSFAEKVKKALNEKDFFSIKRMAGRYVDVYKKVLK